MARYKRKKANLKNEEAAIQSYLDIHNRFVNTKDEKLLLHPEYRKLLSSFENIINMKAEALYYHGLKFHYEEKLVMGDLTCYPDFII